mmetsp:Transcript_58659/g.104318  ORF Transcript_58659/g.104318 Transcript_58659/m.104318 type:complete len:238 (-) Transcript_58659:236-949(-)
MVWVKLVNLPSILSKFVQSVIPSEKKKKVGVVEDPKADLLQFFEANQLEARYGGSQQDCAPAETYPFRFFPGATGNGAVKSDGSSTSAASRSTATGTTSYASDGEEDEVVKRNSDSEGLSLHQHTSRAFHEGQLWDTNVTDSWLHQARLSSLTQQAAKALTGLNGGVVVQPCQTLARWKELLAESSLDQMPVLLSSQRISKVPCQKELRFNSENAKPKEVGMPKTSRSEKRRTLISL